MNKILILFLSLLPCAAVFCQDSLPVIPDEEYRLACGPIAGLIALESLGVATDLSEIASRCHWVKDKMLPLSDLCNGISSYPGIECKSAQLSPNDLSRLLTDDRTVVILALRKNSEEIDHAVCAVDVQENGQIIHLIDYPELHQKKLIGEIADKWDGAALVVRISPVRRALDDFSVCFAPLVLVLFGFAWFRTRKRSKKTISPNELR